jgi:hypothetical protein
VVSHFSNSAIDTTIVVDLILDALLKRPHALYDTRSSDDAYWTLDSGKGRKERHKKGILASLILDDPWGFGYPHIQGADRQELRLWLQYIFLNADIYFAFTRGDQPAFWIDCTEAPAGPRWFDESHSEIPGTALLLIVEYHDDIVKVKTGHGWDDLPSYLHKERAKWSRKLGSASSQSGRSELQQRTQKLLDDLFPAHRRLNVAETKYDWRAEDGSFILGLGGRLDRYGFFTGPSIRDTQGIEVPKLDVEPSNKLSAEQWEKRTEYRNDIHALMQHFEPPLINALMKGETRPRNCREVISVLVALHTCRELLDQMAWCLVERAISSNGGTLYRDFQAFERVANAFAFRDSAHLPQPDAMKPLLPRLDQQNIVPDWPDFTLDRAIENLRVSWDHHPPKGMKLKWFK